MNARSRARSTTPAAVRWAPPPPAAPPAPAPARTPVPVNGWAYGWLAAGGRPLALPRLPPRRTPAPHLGRGGVSEREHEGAIAGRIAALVGHEIRSPLATALVYLSLLEDRIGARMGEQPVRVAMSMARGEIALMEKLVGRIIELEQIGHPVIRAKLVDLGMVVAGAVERALSAEGAAARASVVVARGTGLLGWWDDTAVEQIVRNLLSNALKFGNGRPVRIGVMRTATGGGRLLVRDEGRGINVVQARAIFDPYVRSSPERAGGLGLGLWLVKQLAEAHGGSVGLHSRPGKGSEFSVELAEANRRRGPVAAAAGPRSGSSGR
jgi:signal transduction histidine kinase